MYVHVARGRIVANGEALEAGDALALTDTGSLTLANGADAEVLVFDLAWRRGSLRRPRGARDAR